MNHHVITQEQFVEFQALQRLRVVGYVRKEMLELSKAAGNTAALTVVPTAPKSGNWVAIYAEEDAA